MPELHEQINKRWSALKNERSSWLPTWMGISDYILPYAGRFTPDDANRGNRRDVRIYDNTATRAVRTLGAGLMAGMTSPAQPWFKLTTTDPELDEHHSVKVWLAQVTDMMRKVFAQSNTYRSLHGMYEELGGFGTGVSIVAPDYENIIHHYPLTIGEYAIAPSAKGRVNTLYREFQMTVAQAVEKFGKDNVSRATRTLYERGALDKWVTVLHAIEPRTERDEKRRDGQNMPWRSVYIEPGERQVLSESGFREFRALAPRWDVYGRDVYGHGPGHEGLGDAMQLQFDQTRKAKAIDFQSDPPLQAPTAYKYEDLDTLPGGISFVDAPQAGGGIRSAFDVQLDTRGVLEDIQDIRQRLHSTFFTDLFRMLELHESPQMTAYEVAKRQEEKLLMLGPVLERTKNEIHDPLVEMTFASMVEANILPPPPVELQGTELAVEYISVVAQAQKAAGLASIDRYITTMGEVASFKPEVLDNLDADKLSDVYADKLGVDPEIIVPGRQVALVRKQRAQQAQQQQTMATIGEASQSAKNLADADTSGQNALTDIAKAVG